MEIDFKIQNDGSPPIVYIDGQQLAVVHFTYSYHTKTDKVEESNLYIVDGYLEESDILRRFLHDIKTGLTTEVSLNPLENETGRIFEVCVDTGKCYNIHTIYSKSIKKGGVPRWRN